MVRRMVWHTESAGQERDDAISICVLRLDRNYLPNKRIVLWHWIEPNFVVFVFLREFDVIRCQPVTECFDRILFFAVCYSHTHVGIPRRSRVDSVEVHHLPI